MSKREERQVWEARVAAWQASGLSVRRFSDREGLVYRTMARWLHRVGTAPKRGRPLLAVSGAVARVVPIEVQRAPMRVAPMEIRVQGGRVIAVTGEFDDDRLARLIGIVERAA